MRSSRGGLRVVLVGRSEMVSSGVGRVEEGAREWKVASSSNFGFYDWREEERYMTHRTGTIYSKGLPMSFSVSFRDTRTE